MNWLKQRISPIIESFQNTPIDRITKPTMPLSAAQHVAAEFDFTGNQVRAAVKEFLVEIDQGLAADKQLLSQIPTFVTAVPKGTEKGLYMAVDLGGTNFRVCSIQLNGDSTFTLTQSKVKIPASLMKAKLASELFAFLAEQIQTFLKEHHEEHYTSHIVRLRSGEGIKEKEIFDMGFTFSFPVQQVSINSGYLIRWTKGFDIDDAIGKDVCLLLQTEIDALKLPVRIAALVNDTVGTLLARSYTSPDVGGKGALVGAIFGTGTNAAYVEKLSRLAKVGPTATGFDRSTGEMILNSEWGSFDNTLKVLPNTMYDAALDADTHNKGIQMYEKRISGMYLGEILRRALLSLLQDPEVPLFSDRDSSQNDLHTTTIINKGSPLYRMYGVDSAFLSLTAGDASTGLQITRQAMARDFGVDSASVEDAKAVQVIANAIGRRAARLSAVGIGAVVVASGRLLEDETSIVDIGVDGSLVEFYPGFEIYMREALREIPEIGKQGEKRIRMGIAKDGSGVGAALAALVASQATVPYVKV